MAINVFGLIILFVVIGVALWLINTYVPMAQPIKTIMNVVVVVLLCIYLLQLFWPGTIVIRK